MKNPYKKERRLLLNVLDFATDCISISRHWDDMPADSLEKTIANKLDNKQADENMVKLLEASLWIIENTGETGHVLRLRFDKLEDGLDLSVVEMDESELDGFYKEMTDALEEKADAFQLDDDKAQWCVNPYKEIGSRLLERLPPHELSKGFSMLGKDIAKAEVDGKTFELDFDPATRKSLTSLAKLVELMGELATSEKTA